MAKNTLPALKYDTELVSGSIQNAIKAAGGEKVATGDGAVYMVPVDALRILEGFNIRIVNEEYEAQVEGFEKSIKSEGFLKNRPLTGFAAKVGDDNVIYLTDGHRRYEAVQRINAGEGEKIERVPVLMEPATMTLEDHLVGLATSNSGNPLTMFEKALLAKRLDNMGVARERIAARLVFTERHLNNMLKLAGAPSKIRNAIIDGKVSATDALKLMRTKGDKAGEALDEGLADAAKKGKTKATGKNLGGGESTGGGDDEPDGASVTTKGDKVFTTIRTSFKKGQTIPVDNMLAYARFNSGEWFNWVDSATKADAFIEQDISFKVTIVTKADEVPDDDKPETDVTKAQATALADQSLEKVGEGEDDEL